MITKKTLRWVAALLAFMVGGLMVPAGAQVPQLPLDPSPTPSSPPPPPPEPEPEPEVEPEPEPSPSRSQTDDGGGGSGGGGGGSSGGGSHPQPAQPQPAPGHHSGHGPQASVEQPPALIVPNILRTPSNTTSRLLEILAPLADKGVPLEQAMVLASAPFPVAGQAWFSHDFGYPRYIPYPHLHEGTDIFAAMGTPIVASGGGVVSGMSTGGIGGISVWISGDDGAGYYYTHMVSFAEGLHVGQVVQSGTVIGYVGNTGNAAGTPPHLHFEIHPPLQDRKGRLVAGGATSNPDGSARTNTPAADPKPYLDAWLEQAELNAQGLVSELSQRFATIAREVRFGRKVQDLYGTEPASLRPSTSWLQFFGPSIGVLGLAQDAVAAGVLSAPGSFAERTERERMLTEVRAVVASRDVRLAQLTGWADLTAEHHD